jgi:hypothetical protein
MLNFLAHLVLKNHLKYQSNSRIFLALGPLPERAQFKRYKTIHIPFHRKYSHPDKHLLILQKTINLEKVKKLSSTVNI